ncbi:AAA family ATPase [Paenibacillus dakarensis]|uniref:AAA family ATPase n=1 Tax=Paenibacillus dakarensis TaxID=1527293 RepID=UPI0006D58258|nr:uridine kinase [Paenibacillus dakarensis]
MQSLKRNHVYKIGIAGGSGSGKTRLSLYLEEQLSQLMVKVIHMDHYYKQVRPVYKAPFTDQEYEDFNHPDAVDLNRLYEEYTAAVQSHTFDVVIIEGFLLFHFPEFRNTLDVKVYIDCLPDERMVRRMAWFLEKGYTYDEFTKEYLDLVRYRHDEFVEPTKWFADIILNGSKGTHKGTEILLKWILMRCRGL